jgi:hypothetical protein
VHLLVRVNVNVPERDCSTTVGLFTHVPTYIPADEHQSGELVLTSVVYSYVERARVHVFGYVHVHDLVHEQVQEQVHVHAPISSKSTN